MWMEELPNGKFTYRERYKDPYTEKYKKVSVTLNSKSNQAKNKAQRMLNEKIDKTLNNKTFGKITYQKLIEEFWKFYPSTVKDTTALRMKCNLNILEKKIPYDYLMNNIDQPYLQKIIDEIYYEDNYSLSTTRQIKSLIYQVFSFATSRGYISYDPSKEIKIKAKSNKIQNNIIENKFLEHEEIHALVENIYRKRYRDIAEFMALTGVRYGELAALQYDNDFDDYFVINGTLDYNSHGVTEGFKSAPKTNKATRKVLHTDRTKEIIEEIKEENKFSDLKKEFNNTGFIFCGMRGNPIHLCNFNRAMQIAAKKAGVKKTVSSHILRHTHISILSELGVELKTIMDRVGHAKPDVTLSIYTHVTKNMQQSMVEKLNNYAL